MDSTSQLRVEGMTCQACARSVTKKLRGVAGVSSAAVNLEAGQATVQHDASAKLEDMIAAVEQIGFHATHT